MGRKHKKRHWSARTSTLGACYLNGDAVLLASPHCITSSRATFSDCRNIPRIFGAVFMALPLEGPVRFIPQLVLWTMVGCPSLRGGIIKVCQMARAYYHRVMLVNLSYFAVLKI